MISHRGSEMSIHQTEYPGFRFIDILRAVSTVSKSLGEVEYLDAQSHESLADLLNIPPNPHNNRSIVTSATTSWPKGPDEELSLPSDGFRIVGDSGRDVTLFRVRFLEYTQKVMLEIASTNRADPTSLTEQVNNRSISHSVYRGSLLHFTYQAGKSDEYGDVESAERLQVTFARIGAIPDEGIILSDQTRALLKRNVIDLFHRREILSQQGIPTRRGVLLYGPPGTGKTFACRHVCHLLPEVTKIFVTGASLGNVGAIFTLARLLQPSIVFIEDADLMFSSRDINLYSSALGEMMDQLDGLRSREDVSVVMTTNAIERIESALKDRPGRISQCIFMGAPKADLRRLLIQHFLGKHALNEDDLLALVTETKGASQAFLKEWVHRSIQISCERLDTVDQRPELRRTDFLEALEEMRAVDEHTGRIIGFHAK